MSAALLRVVTFPDCAIVLLVGGILLIYLEFNKPGSIVFGCLGALCITFSLYGLTHLPLSQLAIGLLCAAFVLLVVGCRYPIYGLVSLAGTVCMCFGLARLVPQSGGYAGVEIAAAILLCVVTTLLGRTALLARRNKRRPSPADRVW